MNSFVITMNKDVIVSQPYKGNPEKVKEIRNRLIALTKNMPMSLDIINICHGLK